MFPESQKPLFTALFGAITSSRLKVSVIGSLVNLAEEGLQRNILSRSGRGALQPAPDDRDEVIRGEVVPCEVILSSTVSYRAILHREVIVPVCNCP